jgi:ABC-type amino acid transport substrate-binding protein
VKTDQLLDAMVGDVQHRQPPTHAKEDSMARSQRAHRAAVDPEVLSPTERDRIVRWRSGELERAGYDVALARSIAARLDIDLHVAADLLADGCSPALAARILL